jgi:hypothetical protein
MKQREIATLFVRVPRDLKTWIEQQAEADDRTINGYVVRTLRNAKAQQQGEAAA